MKIREIGRNLWAQTCGLLGGERLRLTEFDCLTAMGRKSDDLLKVGRVARRSRV